MRTALATSPTHAALESLTQSRAVGLRWGPAWDRAVEAALRPLERAERPSALMALGRLRSEWRCAYQNGPRSGCWPPYLAE